MYLKQTETTGTGAHPARILFYYNRDTLFDDVSLMSNFMAKNMTTQAGDSLTDDYAISDDERDLFGVCVTACLPDIYEAMAKITNSIVPAFDDEVTETGQTTGKDITGATVNVTAGKYIEFYLLDNKAYNANVLTMVDSSLYNALKQGVLREFYSTVIQADFFKVCTERFIAELYKLKQRMFQLKKKTLASNIS